MGANGFFGWNNVGTQSSLLLAIMFAVMYAFIFLDLAVSKTTYVKLLRSWLYDCHMSCEEGSKTCENVDSYRETITDSTPT